MFFQSPHAVLRWLRTWFILVLACLLLPYLWTTSTLSGSSGQAHRILSSGASLYSLSKGDSDSDAKLCRAHGWRPFKTPTSFGWGSITGGRVGKAQAQVRKRKVYDLFMINTELEWLEIRLNTTYDYVDHFILVEASRTFTGLPKPLAIRESWDRLKPYHDKLIYHELQYPADYNPPRAWDREDLQRDAMLTQVFPRLASEDGGRAAPQKGDVLVVADVDEIVRPETLAVLRACDFPRRLTLRSKFYYYSFEFLHRGPEWQHPQATAYGGSVSSTLKPVNLRNGDGGLGPLIYLDKADLWNAGWHCSSCYQTMAEMLHKMASVSHIWMNQDVFRDRDRIASRVREGKDLWDREGEVYDRVENNADLPPYLLQHKERFRHLLDRSGESAGFSDYPP